MVLVPEEVRCAVCKSIFCCLECRNRHELSAHNPNDVWAERNRMQCGLCQGYPTMEFQCRNDFALIMHLCQAHLPLHCKKCRTQFNSISDFSSANKCSHMNDVCSLQSPKDYSTNKIDNQSACTKDASHVNFVTAVQKSSFEKSISDSVISLRNYSTILHTSNHPLYKTQSPDAMEKALVRQTSTPMHHNLMCAKSPDDNGQCSSCLTSSLGYNSSSDSDTSTNPTNDIRQNVQQQSIMVTQKKTTTIKRSRHSLAVTPLTRQVMTKSIHRAILEYQHSQHGTVLSPKSPLDLRVRSTSSRDTSKTEHLASKSIEKSRISMSAVLKTNSMESRTSALETVYEQEKDANTDAPNCFDHENYVEIVEHTNDNHSIVNELMTSEPIGETPVLVSRKLSSEKIGSTDGGDHEVWYTPKEFVQTKIYTPKVSKKRTTVRRFDDDEYDTEIESQTPIESIAELGHDSHLSNVSKSEPKKSSGSKIWSYVSTFLRFASFTPDLSMPEMKGEDVKSHVIIKRCASFTGILREKNPQTPSDGEESESDSSQPIKRRRVTSIDTLDASLEPANYRKRIMCRPPIRRMLNN
ncbi:mitosis initiation protein fs(1)Ya isoform X2 [Sitodiplosis mosellana]|uniref:mitosis initiation protein fs(1)Ya isoform X2 n=1 Tax=Sitodiplosis mosellana TaxID=263140 RepID=UPI0024448073|nr:mitosis initiation protein fs(1)Ya isoform X2 [Sitodiplosis mosellana]